MQRKIIAIGGGENGAHGTPYETAAIDAEIVRLSEGKNPKLLFIGTASMDSEGYYRTIQRMFRTGLGCRTDSLPLINTDDLKAKPKEKILGAEIIYVGGGNTKRMLEIWRETGVDALLKSAWEKGSVLSGLSAGSGCWFKYCISDSNMIDGIGSEYILLECLSFISAVHCPHYDVEEGRPEALKRLLAKVEEPLVAIALCNCAAIEIVDDTYRIITSHASAFAYRTYWLDGKYHKETIAQTEDYRPLKDLITHPIHS